MIPYRTAVFTLSFSSVTFCGALTAISADVPERSESGQTLWVPTEQQTLGEVYYVIPGAGTQLTWEADAPLLRQVAVCNRVVGYFIAPFEFGQGRPPLLGGALRIPVASISTGYEQEDAGLHGADGLNREKYPEILVSLVSAAPAEKVVRENNTERCECNLAGDLTIKDKTIRFEAPARTALLPFARATERFSPSDLLVVQMRFNVSLTDLGLASAAAPGPSFTGRTVDLELHLLCTTIHPEKNLDPRVSDDLFVKQLKFMTQLRDFDDPEGAYVYGRTLLKEIWDDSRMLNDIAWGVLTDEHVARRDFAFVEKAALRANKLTEHKDPQYLNTLARLYYERGELDKAVKWSSKAVDNLAGQPFFVGPPIRAALQDYEAQMKMRQDTAKVPGDD